MNIDNFDQRAAAGVELRPELMSMEPLADLTLGGSPHVANTGKAHRILIVDDAKSNLDLLSEHLTSEHQLSFAINGEAALRLAGKKGFDLVLLDIMMPGIDGYETCRRLKGMPHMREVPVIFMSGLEEIRSKTLGFDAGGVDYITKPFEIADVRARVNVHLKLRALMHDLREERERSNRLLNNILPKSIADQLKLGRPVTPRNCEACTVVFADLSGFTTLAQAFEASMVVSMLNKVFCRFDELVVKHGLDKIKTIGDCYMAVSGLSHNAGDQVSRAADFALDVMASFDELKEEDGYTMDLRVGMHTGSVIAGVIGLHRFAYDLWGDTVNIASRMESQGLPGRIQVSHTVRCRLEERYVFEERGEIEIRGWGPMKTWWLASRSPE